MMDEWVNMEKSSKLEKKKQKKNIRHGQATVEYKHGTEYEVQKYMLLMTT